MFRTDSKLELFIGFVIYSSNPSFKNLSLSPFKALAVNATIGVCFLPCSSSSSSIACKALTPSITGIAISIKIISNLLFFTLSTASCPFTARVTFVL